MTHTYSLFQLGWQAFFQQQLSLQEWEHCNIARVTAQEKSLLTVLTTQGKQILPLLPSMPEMTVGDWILLDNEGRFLRMLERSSLFSRKAAGTKVATQLIAANIDTVFIVCSLNQDFNLNRIERYLVLAHEAGTEAVVVLTKLDCCDNPDDYIQQVQTLDPMLMVIAVNSLNKDSVSKLDSWCATGRTVAFLGSSGVGKSTLINTLSGQNLQRTSAIREDDDKGRHTTTSRTLHLLSTGGLLLDTPGMRELQLANCEQGIEDTFADITALAAQCKFSDCQHQNEPGCCVREAIDSGALDERRLLNYFKLLREQMINSESLAEKRARDRNLGRYYRSVLAEVNKRKKE